ncbi:MAG: pyridoxamine 5-phosphate oxidase [Nitrospirae bacterium]|nr:MAG: pyridoxamine 5-phosphate oxidase [Nitrospirota bacterium]
MLIPPSKPVANLPGSSGEHQAQARFGTQRRALSFYQNQMLDYLTPRMQAFIRRQEMVLIATADARGECDCSFRAGPPGFVSVLSEKVLCYPEYRGNGVLASVGNILENPHIGMLFLDFFQSTVGLHVNGRAQVVENDHLLARPDIPPEIEAAIRTPGGQHPERWIVVEVEEAYIHCAKHIPLLKKLDKPIHWGTDDERDKGGDYFQAKGCPRPWNTVPADE